jgi:hypothetical protein
LRWSGRFAVARRAGAFWARIVPVGGLAVVRGGEAVTYLDSIGYSGPRFSSAGSLAIRGNNLQGGAAWYSSREGAAAPQPVVR